MIIKRDLEAAAIDPRTVRHLELEKFAIGVPPYVLWKAGVASERGSFRVLCDYTMDAFTGQILEKMPAIQSLGPLTPEHWARMGCPQTDRK